MRVRNLGFLGYNEYEVDDQGNVYSLNYGRTGERRMMKPTPNSRGYLCVILRNNGKKKTWSVHQLVGFAFIGDWRMLGLTQFNHKNEDKTDNRVENIEPCDARYNNTYGTRLERMAKKRYKKVSQYTKDGTYIKTYESVKEAGKITGISKVNISCCLIGKSKSAGDYIWRYYDPDLPSKLDIDYVDKTASKKVSQYTKDGEFIRTFDSIREAGKLTDIPHSNISSCCKGIYKTAGGFIWRYA